MTRADVWEAYFYFLGGCPCFWGERVFYVSARSVPPTLADPSCFSVHVKSEAHATDKEVMGKAVVLRVTVSCALDVQRPVLQWRTQCRGRVCKTLKGAESRIQQHNPPVTKARLT